MYLLLIYLLLLFSSSFLCLKITLLNQNNIFTIMEPCLVDLTQISIDSLIWPFEEKTKAPWLINKEAKVFRSNCFDKVYEELMGEMFSEKTRMTIGELFGLFAEKKCTFFIHGGFLRDVLRGKTPNDVDAQFNCDIDSLNSTCLLLPPEVCYCNKYGYLHIGDTYSNDDKYVSFESKTWGQFPFSIVNQEYTPNSLYYDSLNKIILDISGKAIEDIKNKMVRIPPQEPQWERWFYGEEADPSLRLIIVPRYFKLRQAGFDNIHNETFNYIIEKTAELWNNDTTNMKQIFFKYLCIKVLKGAYHRNNSDCLIEKGLEEKNTIKFWSQVDLMRKDLSGFGNISDDITNFTQAGIHIYVKFGRILIVGAWVLALVSLFY